MPADAEGIERRGDNKIRKQIADEFKDFTFTNCISPHAIVSRTAKLGQGNYFTNMMPDSIIGSHNIINDASMAGHDAQLGDYNLIAAYVCCGAYSDIGDSNLLGINVSVNPTRIKIGHSVVINDIDNNNVVVGVPGRSKYMSNFTFMNVKLYISKYFLFM
jgi:acetyltransferase-like isoleucine patch superfamily enzyme